jgi:hypothetical protein
MPNITMTGLPKMMPLVLKRRASAFDNPDWRSHVVASLILNSSAPSSAFTLATICSNGGGSSRLSSLSPVIRPGEGPGRHWSKLGFC